MSKRASETEVRNWSSDASMKPLSTGLMMSWMVERSWVTFIAKSSEARQGAGRSMIDPSGM